VIFEKTAPRLPGGLFLIVIATSALGTFSCTSPATDAISSATAALSIPAESVPAGETKVLMIIAASPAGSTAKVARAIADELGSRVVDYSSRNHAALRGKLRAKGCEIVGEFGCPGFNDNKFLKLFGGFNRGRPNAADLGSANSFAKGLKQQLSLP
jgi:hypothetical protein